MGEVILTMKGIDKSFPGVHALDHVDLEIRKGEVHALMGENGAGKSTLMKVLTGIYSKDSGSITFEGKEVEFANPRWWNLNGTASIQFYRIDHGFIQIRYVMEQSQRHVGIIR